MTLTRTYTVPDISCDHCKNAIESEVGDLQAVETVDVDVAARTVTVTGSAEEPAIIAAIGDAGYEVAAS